MVIKTKKIPPDYEQRIEIECVTLIVSMLSTGSGGTRITAHLDEGLSSEREVTWDHAKDFPVFIFRKTNGT